MSPSNHRWLDRDAGPVVRLYAVTQGRARPTGAAPLDLISVVVATGRDADHSFRWVPEHNRILRRCRKPTTVADLASDIDLPVLSAIRGSCSAAPYRMATSRPSAG